MEADALIMRVLFPFSNGCETVLVSARKFGSLKRDMPCLPKIPTTPVKSAFGGASASVGAKSKAKARANVVAVESIRVRGKQPVKSMRLRGKQVVRGGVGAKPKAKARARVEVEPVEHVEVEPVDPVEVERVKVDPADATAERTTAETKFRVLNFLHLKLGVRIGQTYSYGELLRRCRDDAATIAEMRKKLGDPHFFEEIAP